MAQIQIRAHSRFPGKLYNSFIFNINIHMLEFYVISSECEKSDRFKISLYKEMTNSVFLGMRP